MGDADLINELKAFMEAFTQRQQAMEAHMKTIVELLGGISIGTRKGETSRGEEVAGEEDFSQEVDLHTTTGGCGQLSKNLSSTTRQGAMVLRFSKQLFFAPDSKDNSSYVEKSAAPNQEPIVRTTTFFKRLSKADWEKQQGGCFETIQPSKGVAKPWLPSQQVTTASIPASRKSSSTSRPTLALFYCPPNTEENPQSMQLLAATANCKVCVPIDAGSISTFLRGAMILQLGISIQERPVLRNVVANRDKVLDVKWLNLLRPTIWDPGSTVVRKNLNMLTNNLTLSLRTSSKWKRE